jgi:hypothetical protein
MRGEADQCLRNGPWLVRVGIFPLLASENMEELKRLACLSPITQTLEWLLTNSNCFIMIAEGRKRTPSMITVWTLYRSWFWNM